MLRGTTHSAEARAKIARRTAASLARKRARERIAPSEIAELERHGTISRSMRPFAIQAAQVPHDVAEDLGGVDAISAQVRVMLADLGRLDLVQRTLVAHFLQQETPDPDIASKVATIAGQKRATLLALGLERRERDAIDLRAYLAAQSATSATNGGDPSPEPARTSIAAQERTE